MVQQFNELKRQLAERDRKAAIEMSQMKADLEAAKAAAKDAESGVETKIRKAVSDKQKEVDDLVLKEQHIREAKALAEENAAQARKEAEQVMQMLEESRAIAKQAEEDRLRAEEDKQRALTALVVDDYINKPKQDAAPPPPKREFSITCEYMGETPVKMLMEGLSYARDVKPNMREKIINMFVSMGDILYDTAASNNLRAAEQAEMYSPEYLAQNVPPPTNIKSKLELFNRLFFFASYYLQKYPEKTVSFFDYLMYLMEQADVLDVPDLVMLDHRMRQDFACHPDWNWGQHRPESLRTIDRVTNKIKIAAAKAAVARAHLPFGGRGGYAARGGRGRGHSYGNNQVQGGRVNKKHTGKPKITEEMVKDKHCLSWNAGNCSCPPGKRCWRKHVCLQCDGDHMVINCPERKRN